jgi:hypothetical protein
MGWDDEHLHRFRIHGQDYGIDYIEGKWVSPSLTCRGLVALKGGERPTPCPWSGLSADLPGDGRLVPRRCRMQEIHLPASVAERLCLSSLRWGRRALEDVRWIAAVSKLSWAYIADGRNRFPRYTQAATDMVSCDMVRDQPEKRCQRIGLAAGARIWKLRDCVDLAPQAASGDGSAWSGSSCRECRGVSEFLCARLGQSHPLLGERL